MATVMYGMSPDYDSWRPDYTPKPTPIDWSKMILPPPPTQDSPSVTPMWTKSGDCTQCNGPIFYRLNPEGIPETLRQCAKGCIYAAETKEPEEEIESVEDDVLI